MRVRPIIHLIGIVILPMRKKRIQRLADLACNIVLAVSVISSAWQAPSQAGQVKTPSQPATWRAPILGADLYFANDVSPLIVAWQDHQGGDLMATAFPSAGLQPAGF